MTRHASLEAVLRRLEENESSARLSVRGQSDRGEVAVKAGQLVAATSGGHRGRDALFALLFEEAEVSQELLSPEPAAEMPFDARMASSPITLTMKRFHRLAELWRESWCQAVFVADDTSLMGGNSADTSLLLYFDRPVQASEAVKAGAVRVGAALERMDKLMTLGVLVKLDSDAPQPQPSSQYARKPSSQFMVQVTSEMIDGYVKAASEVEHPDGGSSRGHHFTEHLVSERSEPNGSIPVTIVVSDSTGRRSQYCSCVERLGISKDVLGLSSSGLKEALLHPNAPVLLDGIEQGQQSLSSLRQLMLLSPRPILWIYQRPEDAGIAMDAMRFGAVGAWRQDGEEPLEGWFRVLTSPGRVHSVKRLRYVNTSETKSSLADVLAAVLIGKGGVTAAIELLCNIDPALTPATLLLHWLPHDQASAFFQLLDRHSPFCIRDEAGEGLLPGQLLISHWRNRRLATPCQDEARFRLLSAIDDGTPEMWLSQLNAQNDERVRTMVLGTEVFASHKTLGSSRAPFCYVRSEDAVTIGQQVSFEDLTNRFAQALREVGTPFS